jgi:hypothetical protein
LKIEYSYGETPFKFAFNFNLRRYTWGIVHAADVGAVYVTGRTAGTTLWWCLPDIARHVIQRISSPRLLR